MLIVELLAAVDDAFERAGGRDVGWADPHPDRSPADDEYSRVTDPAKWRIVGTRADAWMEALVATGSATVDPDARVAWVEPPPTVVTSSALVVPRVPEGLPLVLARSRIDSVDDAGVSLGVGQPAVLVGWIPDCGCDACDSGSEDVLDQLDEYLTAVVTGTFRHLRRGKRTVMRLGDSGQGRNVTGRMMDAVLADPRGWDELRGPSWLRVP